MSAQRSTGIQTLLEAERKAHEIVQTARAFRTNRLRAAKADASKDIEEYKAEKEQEFRKYEASHSGSNDQAEKDAELAVQSQLDEIKQQASSTKASVVDKLIQAVTTPQPELHINA
ncbi:V-type ATPase [Nadsonia fulvescens var. elongata DSM 6958]|uniref:V-type proton ATPase subunit G n=1 Tax=Nadsonia fulvescens var. elongata DSM 6958 TaxID=857566 RepID=A0A1E3PS49_9ASCO|nr:V-type ATPase [Nadsonia fulvescens var. elongata DSM 6958]